MGSPALFVRIAGRDDVIAVTAPPAASVDDLKLLIEDAAGPQCGAQHLSFAGTPLCDGAAQLADCGLSAEAEAIAHLQAVLRLEPMHPQANNAVANYLA